MSQNDVLCVLWVEVKQKRRSYETDNYHCYACLAALQRCRNSLSAQRRHYTCTGVCGQRFQHFRRPFSRHKGPKEAGWEGRSHRHTRISGEGFRPHRLRNNSNIYFTQGNETHVVAKLHHGNLDLLEVSTHNGCLKLRTADLGLPTKRFSIGKRNRSYIGDLDGKHSEQQEVDLYITATSLRKLEMSGVCTFSAEHLNVPKLDIVMAGVNTVKLSDVTCNETNMMISGVSSMDATITGDQIHLVNTGSGNTTIHFKGTKAEIVNSGVGVLAAKVDCKTLRAVNSGVAQMILKGTADDTDIDNSGMGRINTKGLNNY